MEKIENTSPLVMDGKKLTRRFLGELLPKNCLESKELQAYVAGGSNYIYKGISYMVRQKYFYQ